MKKLIMSNKEYIKILMAKSIRRSQVGITTTFKTIIIGDSGIGKTALIQKYMTGGIQKQTNATVGVDFYSKTFKLEDRYLQMQIWDTSGQDVYRSVTSSFYRGASAVFLVYAMNSYDSFRHLSEWVEQFYQKGSKDAMIFVVGTKSDLPSQVQSSQVLDLMKTYEATFCSETSVTEGQSVKLLFQKAAQSMYKLFSISQDYRQLVNRQRQTVTKQSSFLSSGISLYEMRSINQQQKSIKGKKCC